MSLLKKPSLRRSQVRRKIPIERLARISQIATAETLLSLLIWVLFVALCVPILAFELIASRRYADVVLICVIVVLICTAAGLYVSHFQKRITKNHTRAIAIAGLCLLLLAATRATASFLGKTYGSTDLAEVGATGSAVTAAIILTMAYDQRFAIGMSVFYCLLACFAAMPVIDGRYQLPSVGLFMTIAAGAIICCFCLKEIRTRIKLLKVSTFAAMVVFITAAALDFLAPTTRPVEVVRNAAIHGGVTLGVGIVIEGLLPVIEKVFRIATSMTLLDYSDANQPLLKRLHMEAPGTFSHSLLISSIAEAAAEAIGRNGLLSRVGAYYHDVGKLNKPGYFVENQMGSISRHKELAPAMSQLIIVGHVKDGIELAKEYGLPSVLRQFIETHHGTTLIEHFYHEAVKSARSPMKDPQGKIADQPSESEFRYPGPKPRTKEAAIVMLADTVEGAVRSLADITPSRIETVVHNMAMKRLQDGQFDECDLTLLELSRIEASISKTLAAHYHGRIAYPHPPDAAEGNPAWDK
jgi:hypothetical protein